NAIETIPLRIECKNARSNGRRRCGLAATRDRERGDTGAEAEQSERRKARLTIRHVAGLKVLSAQEMRRHVPGEGGVMEFCKGARPLAGARAVYSGTKDYHGPT